MDMIYFIHFRRFVFWISTTFIFGIIVSLAFLFSRQLTLNTVKINEFKIYYSFLSEMNTFNPNEIKKHLNILLSNKTKYPLLPLAIVSEKQCIENVLPKYNRLSICNDLNFNMLNNSSQLTVHKSYKDKIIEYNNKHFIYKKLDKSNTWLISQIADYYKVKDFQRFVKYIINDTEGLSWLRSFNSFKVFMKKSKFIWFTIIPFSILLFIIYTLYYLNQTKKLKALNKEKNQYISQWNILNATIKELILEQSILEKELKEKSELKDINKSLNDEIDNLEFKNKELLDKIDSNIIKLKAIELKENNIANELSIASKKLTYIEKEKILNDSLNKLNQIDLLWKYKPTWKERHDIENIVSLRDEFTPFTISQAFICFEKIIENLVIKENANNKYITLAEQINIIFEKDLLPIQFKKDLHSIRIARNKWFHTGTQPTTEVYTILLDILDKTNTQPLL